jgi:hypothetical protein
MGQCYEFGVTIKEGCGHAMRVPTEAGACVCPTCKARCEGRFEACARIVSEPGYVPVTAPRWAIDCTEPPETEAPLPRRATASGPGFAAAPDAPGDEVGTLRTVAWPRIPGRARPDAPGDEVGTLRTEIDAAKAELLALVKQMVGNRAPDSGTDPEFPAVIADAVEQAQSRLIDSLRAQLLQSLRPSIIALRDELLGAIDEVRREFADRDKELVSAYDRLNATYGQLVEGLGSDRSTDKAVVEGLARVARRVGRIERAFGQSPPT